MPIQGTARWNIPPINQILSTFGLIPFRISQPIWIKSLPNLYGWQMNKSVIKGIEVADTSKTNSGVRFWRSSFQRDTSNQTIAPGIGCGSRRWKEKVKSCCIRYELVDLGQTLFVIGKGWEKDYFGIHSQRFIRDVILETNIEGGSISRYSWSRHFFNDEEFMESETTSTIEISE